MKKSIFFLYIICLKCFFIACVPPKSQEAQKRTSNATVQEDPNNFIYPYDPDPIDEQFKNGYRPRYVSRFRIDDRDFQVEDVATPLKEYLDSETIYVAFERPRDADYVEILRCSTDVILNTGVVTMNFQDWGISGVSQMEKDRIYRAADIMSIASQKQECTYLTAGSAEENVPDAWANTGEYRYLVTACVTPGRLIDTGDGMSSRNCSSRFAISPVISYVNKRKEKEQEYLREKDKASSELDMKANRLGFEAMELIQEINLCEEREYQRAVDTKLKNAIITVASAALEIAIELKTVQTSPKMKNGKQVGNQSRYSHYTSRGNTMDKIQLLQAIGGMSFSMIFIKIFTSPQDMPRACEKALSLEKQMKVSMDELLSLSFNYGYFHWAAEAVRKNLEWDAGFDDGMEVDNSSLQVQDANTLKWIQTPDSDPNDPNS